ncbi:hypothetical protein [Arthrobacter sp. U41]|uniref:hypothetical protein n=1 Tax=Arthrobacter sp. U41 TaxID=1849032 RepID=UPI0008596C10|nr:hypothetical protein [Arthrobacter sp. U41]AOT05852.1 hypothetical protein ASPU41_20745 [Arthrobacter sp. U41]
MDTLEELGPELVLAFTCVAAVGSSMVRHFRIEDAKSCTRVCRRILLCAAIPQSPDTTNNACALTCIDAITTATTLLARRLCPLDDIDTKYLGTAEAAIASLRQDLTSDAAIVLQST